MVCPRAECAGTDFPGFVCRVKFCKDAPAGAIGPMSSHGLAQVMTAFRHHDLQYPKQVPARLRYDIAQLDQLWKAAEKRRQNGEGMKAKRLQ
jgi:hypothetical protein